jgi:hypothetical protein
MSLPPNSGKRRIIDAINSGLPVTAGPGLISAGGSNGTVIGLDGVVGFGKNFWVGLVQSAGPNGEADYTDHRYWIRRAYLSNAAANPNTAAPQAVTYTPLDSTDQWYIWVTVTNNAEALDSSHNLDVGTRVLVWEEADAVGQTKYYTFASAGGIGLYRITGVDTALGYYTMFEQVLTDAPDPTVDLDLADYYTDGQAVCGLNTDENYWQHTHPMGQLRTDGHYYVLGVRRGMTGDSSPIPLVLFGATVRPSVGDYNCNSYSGDPTAEGTWNDQDNIYHISFQEEDFVVQLSPIDGPDRVTVDWNGMTVKDSLTTKVCHTKMLSFDVVPDPETAEDYTPYDVSFTVTESFEHDPCSACSEGITKKEATISSKVNILNLSIRDCTDFTYTLTADDNNTFALGPGFELTDDRIDLKFVASTYAQVNIAEGDPCAYEVDICNTTVTVATGNIVDASEGDPQAFLGDVTVTCDPSTGEITVTKTWKKNETIDIVVLQAC